MVHLQLDFFQINFALIFSFVTAELILGTLPTEPLLPLLSMPTPTVLLLVGFQLIISHFMYLAKTPIPFRISSLPRGSTARPLVYTIIEDIIGVDGGGRVAFREDLNRRYEASPLFRQMLYRLNAFWGFGAVAVAGIVTALLWTIPGEVAFGIGKFFSMHTYPCFSQADMHGRMDRTCYMGQCMGFPDRSLCEVLPR